MVFPKTRSRSRSQTSGAPKVQTVHVCLRKVSYFSNSPIPLHQPKPTSIRGPLPPYLDCIPRASRSASYPIYTPQELSHVLASTDTNNTRESCPPPPYEPIPQSFGVSCQPYANNVNHTDRPTYSDGSLAIDPSSIIQNHQDNNDGPGAGRLQLTIARSLLKNARSTGYTCVHTSCSLKFSRLTDLKRHLKAVHDPGNNRLSCPYKWCDHTDQLGFTRKDQLSEHIREVHKNESRKGKDCN